MTTTPPPPPPSPTPSTPDHEAGLGLGSILDEPPSETPTAPAVRSSNPRTKKLVRYGACLVALVGLIAGGVLLWPRSTPDYLNDDLDDVLSYTLLSNDFNNLPIEERLRLLRDLIDRLRTMSGADSAAMAMFASTIKKKMRAQIESNVQQLGIDLMDMYAYDYATVDPESREDFIEDALVNMTRLMEEVTGETPVRGTDEERIDQMKDQAARDEEMLAENAPRRMESNRVVPFIQYLQRDAAEVSTPVERARTTKLARDMTRYLREQDISTGKPLEDGGG